MYAANKRISLELAMQNIKIFFTVFFYYFCLQIS